MLWKLMCLDEELRGMKLRLFIVFNDQVETWNSLWLEQIIFWKETILQFYSEYFENFCIY